MLQCPSARANACWLPAVPAGTCLGRLPAVGPSAPLMVYVLPLPVCPYAKQLLLKPATRAGQAVGTPGLHAGLPRPPPRACPAPCPNRLAWLPAAHRTAPTPPGGDQPRGRSLPAWWPRQQHSQSSSLTGRLAAGLGRRQAPAWTACGGPPRRGRWQHLRTWRRGRQRGAWR